MRLYRMFTRAFIAAAMRSMFYHGQGGRLRFLCEENWRTWMKIIEAQERTNHNPTYKNLKHV
jgi:hypothetical protein